jgi:methyl-accepting chemotaxis protein
MSVFHASEHSLWPSRSPWMCFAGAAAVGALFRAADAEKFVNRTIEIRQQARDLLTIMLNAETGIRGFLLSGDEAFLEPYQTAPR